MTRRGLLLFAAMCVIWGIPYLLIRVAVRDVSPAVLVLARTAIAALLLLPLAAARQELRPLVSRWLPLLVFATVEIAIPWVLLGTAEQQVSSSRTALLIAGVPLVGAVIARTTGDRERLGLSSLLGLLGPVRATVITYVNPALAALLGVAILGERFTVGMGVGFALVLAGSALATRPRRRLARPVTVLDAACDTG